MFDLLRYSLTFYLSKKKKISLFFYLKLISSNLGFSIKMTLGYIQKSQGINMFEFSYATLQNALIVPFKAFLWKLFFQESLYYTYF